MISLSLQEGAIELLRKMLAREVAQQVKNGKGEEPMSDDWLELYSLTLGIK